MVDTNAIQEIVKQSDKYVSWSISLYAGSLAAILSTSYVKPPGRFGRLIYLLFLPAWFFLAYAIYYGDSISRRRLMGLIDQSRIPTIELKINDEFISQLDCFKWALLCFGIWLFLFLIS